MVITGAGILTSMGSGYQANAEGFRSGRSALREITLFDTSRQRVGRAGELSLPDELPPQLLSPKHRQRVDRASAMLIHAGHEALAQAGWESGVSTWIDGYFVKSQTTEGTTGHERQSPDSEQDLSIFVSHNSFRR